MPEILSLPMYDVDHTATVALTETLSRRLAAYGVRAKVQWPSSDLLPHWLDNNLLLSQTCGYPLVKLLPDVLLVGAFQSNAPGCKGLCYRSWLVARKEDENLTLADFRGRRAVCNSRDSHSGHNALRYVIAPLAHGGRFFNETLISGSHSKSLIALREGRADIAAIDCITWELLRRNFPEELRGLEIIGETPLCPALPLITSAQTDDKEIETLRRVLTQLVAEEQDLCAASLIVGFGVPDRAYYGKIEEWEQQSGALGVTSL